MPSSTDRAVAGGLAGLAAGVVLSAAWLGMEKATGETSEVVRLGRRGLATAGRRARAEAAPPDAAEQALSHGGHLALSAAAGAGYAVLKPAGASPLLAGAGFGAAFCALAFGVAAPALGWRPALWHEKTASLVQKAGFHLLFGLLTATLTPAIARQL